MMRASEPPIKARRFSMVDIDISFANADDRGHPIPAASGKRTSEEEHG
jgi:hypothetical protein